MAVAISWLEVMGVYLDEIGFGSHHITDFNVTLDEFWIGAGTRLTTITTSTCAANIMNKRATHVLPHIPAAFQCG
jgi:hypothetical protein